MMNVKMEKIRELPVGAKSVFFDSRGEVLATWRSSMYPQQYVLQFWEIESGTLLKSIDLTYFLREKAYAPGEACLTPDWKIFTVGCTRARTRRKNPPDKCRNWERYCKIAGTLIKCTIHYS